MYKMDQKQYLHEVGQNLADLFYNQNKMEAKLILKKTSTGFYLWRNPLDKSQELLGATVPIMNDNGVDLKEYKLSLKNCQAIERGYDLDELAEKACPDVISSAHSAFKAGFQKALELMGDKKFSINEVVELCKILISNPFETSGKTYQELTDNYIQSLQQTEWDVTFNPEELDVDGCLILNN